MTNLGPIAAVAAFVAARPSVVSSVVSSQATKSILQHTTAASSAPARTAPLSLFRNAAAASALADYSGTAISYFSSIRIPAALIAGSSLAALFSLTDEIQDDKLPERSVIESVTLIAYHILALSSLLLSLNVVVTSTAAANSILLAPAAAASNSSPLLATSAYAFLRQHYEFEFLMTRWGFYTALFSFLGSVATRCLLEFQLLSRRRICSALLVVFAVSTLFFHLLAFVNSRLYCYPNMLRMTFAVLQMWYANSIRNPRSASEIASLCSFVGTIVMSVAVFARSSLFSKQQDLADNSTRSSLQENLSDDTSTNLSEGMDEAYDVGANIPS